ncbi:MAG: hypothetical protein INH37_13505, partial [Myxococcaceae bacterium]|nr:hypothetical protein [Myxococcaceae bacterium]
MSATCAIHTDTAATGVCPRCGNFVCGRCELDAAKNCPACVTLVGASQAVELPWERRDQLGLAKAFWEQTKLGIMKPGLYVTSIKPDRPWSEAFFYGWLVSTLASVLSIPYNAFSFWSQSAQLQETFGKLGASGPLKEVGGVYAWVGSHPLLAAAALTGFSVTVFPLTVLFNAALQQVGLVLAGVKPRQPI